MRSLFLKIFLWFGLAMVMVNVASFVIGVATERQFHPQRQNPMAPAFGLYAQTAVEIYERDGAAALASYLERVERASRIRAVLLDEHGAELSGRAVPAGALELARRAGAGSGFVFDFPPPEQQQQSQQSPTQPLAAQSVRSTRGASYTLAGELPRPDFPRQPPRLGERGSLIFGLHEFGLRLLPVLLIGSLFCYLLAKHLTTPVVKLRDTTHALADGNLSARVGHSLTKRRDEIGYLGREFNLMAERIESLVEAQRRLLRDISHELRSPLTRLGVALELVRRRAGPEVATGLDRIEREAESINEMIGQLLTLSRLESGAARMENSRIDLCALVRDIAADADFEAQGRNRSVSIVACEECEVNGVLELLRSAVENVVRNAVHYTAEGTAVEISLHHEDDAEGHRYALISVHDHGPGVPEEAIDVIFRPFYRVEDARDRQTGGTGLGLAIAARAVLSHRGTIRAINAREGGLIVEVRLPV